MFSKLWNPRWASSTATDLFQVAKGRLRTGPHATTSVGGPDRISLQRIIFMRSWKNRKDGNGVELGGIKNHRTNGALPHHDTAYARDLNRNLVYLRS